jgi:adenosine deaminase
MHRLHVVGFDLAGPENGYSSKVHKAAFDIAQSKCLNVTLHSGESAGWDSIQDSLQYCGAQRIGHGTRIIESPELYVVWRVYCMTAID